MKHKIFKLGKKNLKNVKFKRKEKMPRNAHSLIHKHKLFWESRENIMLMMSLKIKFPPNVVYYLAATEMLGLAVSSNFWIIGYCRV